MPPPARPAHAALRAGTAALHTAVERRLDLLGDALTPARYVARLRQLHRVLAPLEARLARHADALAELGLPWPPRRKLGLLARDLATLGARAPARPLPARALPPLADPAAAMGALYVMEGATLGGRILARHIGHHLALRPGEGTAFFASYGAARGRMWRGYLEAAERALAGPASRRRGVAAARATFAAYLAAVPAKRRPRQSVGR